MKQWKKIKLHKTLLQSFGMLLGMIMLLFTAFAVYTYRSTRSALQNEFLNYTQSQNKRLCTSIDDYLMNMRYIAASLSNHSTVRVFLKSQDLDLLVANGSQRILEQLSAYQNSYSAIDSIYLYSPESDIVLTSLPSVSSLSSFTDRNWLEQTENTEKQPYFFFYRRKNNRYPFLLCLAKTMKTSAGNGVILLNLDLSRLPDLASFADNETQDFYIVTDSGELLFRSNQENIPESIDPIPELSLYSPDKKEKQEFVDAASPYIYTQYHSADYPWNYILITTMSDYTTQLTDKRTFMLNFLFCLLAGSLILAVVFVFRSTRPFLSVVRFLDNPGAFSVRKMDPVESREIIQKIMTYIQTNDELTAEMEQKIKLLNDAKLLALQSQINPHFLFNTLNMIRMIEIDSLGYDHEAPAMTLALSKLLQYALESTDLVSLNTEFYYTKIFIKLMDKRYQGKIQFELTLQPEAEDVLVPKLILQPFIENAVFHGFSGREMSPEESPYSATAPAASMEQKVRIRADMQADKCRIIISDNGAGMSEEALKSLLERISKIDEAPANSIGIHNVNLRMHLLYGNNFVMTITGRPEEGTRVELLFPGTDFFM